jgi:hypothetical protein
LCLAGFPSFMKQSSTAGNQQVLRKPKGSRPEKGLFPGAWKSVKHLGLWEVKARPPPRIAKTCPLHTEPHSDCSESAGWGHAKCIMPEGIVLKWPPENGPIMHFSRSRNDLFARAYGKGKAAWYCVKKSEQGLKIIRHRRDQLYIMLFSGSKKAI